MVASNNAQAWGLSGVIDFFGSERSATSHVYESEWFFLKDRIKEGISVLDVGCAQGGFCSIIGEHLTDFSYTGLDINEDMVALAKEKHPLSTFHHVTEGDLSVLEGQKFDLVLVLGILHLHETWRDTLLRAWEHTKGAMIFDLREVHIPTVEDKSRSSFCMDFGGNDQEYKETNLPYNLINVSDALAMVESIANKKARISHYGYVSQVAASASCPVDNVMFNTWCLERKTSEQDV